MKLLRFGTDGTALAGARSASEILYEEKAKLAVVTFWKDLDDMLGGGLAIGEVFSQTGVHLATVAQEILLREKTR